MCTQAQFTDFSATLSAIKFAEPASTTVTYSFKTAVLLADVRLFAWLQCFERYPLTDRWRDHHIEVAGLSEDVHTSTPERTETS